MSGSQFWFPSWTLLNHSTTLSCFFKVLSQCYAHSSLLGPGLIQSSGPLSFFTMTTFPSQPPLVSFDNHLLPGLLVSRTSHLKSRHCVTIQHIFLKQQFHQATNPSRVKTKHTRAQGHSCSSHCPLKPHHIHFPLSIALFQSYHPIYCFLNAPYYFRLLHVWKYCSVFSLPFSWYNHMWNSCLSSKWLAPVTSCKKPSLTPP